MNKEHIKLLVEALRSGEYKQIKGVLHNKQGFCASGVACDVYHKVTGEGAWKWDTLQGFDNTTEAYRFVWRDNQNAFIPAYAVIGWYEHGIENLLFGWNDGIESLTFDQIADELEKHYNLKEVENVTAS